MAAASGSAKARSSSASSTRSSSRSTRRPARCCGRSRPRIRSKGYSIVSAPLYYDGMVITGFAGGDMGVRGRIKAYNAKNGKLLWTFYTIPAPGEFGGDTLAADNDYCKYGGARGLADAGRRSGAGADLLLHRQRGAGLQRLGARGRQPLHRVDRRASRRRRASTAGTSSRCITTSGTTTRRIPSCCSMRRTTARCARASRRSPRPAGSTSSIARPASRSSASRRGRCRRSRGRRRRRRSRTRSAIRSSRSTWTSRRKGSSS